MRKEEKNEDVKVKGGKEGKEEVKEKQNENSVVEERRGENM